MSDVTHLNGLIAGFGVKKRVSITASKTSGQIVSVQNPISQKAIVSRMFIFVETPSLAACGLDAGTATTSTASDNLIDGAGMLTPPNTIYDNIPAAGSGLPHAYLGPNDYLTVTVDNGDANGLVADFLFQLHPLTGGDGQREPA